VRVLWRPFRMSAVANASKLLGRYGDLLGLFSILPLLAHLKFGALMQARERKKTPEVSLQACLPPAASLFLFMLAEVCSASSLLDPADMQVRKAVGEMMRAQRQGASNVAAAVETYEKLVSNSDVFDLVRFMAHFASLAALFGNVALHLQDVDFRVNGRESFLSGMKRSASHLLRNVFYNRFWFFAVLTVAFAVGNWSKLQIFFREQRTQEMLPHFAVLLRTLAITSTILWTSPTGPLPFFAAASGAGSIARASRLVVYERLTLQQLIGISANELTWNKLSSGSLLRSLRLFEGKTSVLGLRCSLALEVWCLLWLVPCALRQRRFALLLPVLALPCVALAEGGHWAALAEPFVDKAIMHVNNAAAVAAFMLIFMGGFATLMACMGMVKLLSEIHNLDKVKF